MTDFSIVIVIIIGIMAGAIGFGVWQHKRNVQSKLHNRV